MNWKEFTAGLSKPDNIQFSLNAPAATEEITQLETFFHITIPEEIKQLYLQTDGIVEELEIVGVIGHLIFPLQQVKDYNCMLRKWHTALRKYLFVSDAGNGDYFGYQIQERRIKSTDVFVWKHEENAVEWMTPSIRAFIEGWTSGKIKL